MQRQRLLLNIQHDAARTKLYKGEKLKAFLGAPGSGSFNGGRMVDA